MQSILRSLTACAHLICKDLVEARAASEWDMPFAPAACSALLRGVPKFAEPAWCAEVAATATHICAFARATTHNCVELYPRSQSEGVSDPQTTA